MNPLKKVSKAVTSEIRTPTVWCKRRQQRIYTAVCIKKFCHCTPFDEWQAEERRIKNAEI
jgi:hypothetical protein